MEKKQPVTANTVFFNSVLGPALTFRLGPNPRNVTTADLVQVAGKSITHAHP